MRPAAVLCAQLALREITRRSAAPRDASCALQGTIALRGRPPPCHVRPGPTAPARAHVGRRNVARVLQAQNALWPRRSHGSAHSAATRPTGERLLARDARRGASPMDTASPGLPRLRRYPLARRRRRAGGGFLLPKRWHLLLLLRCFRLDRLNSPRRLPLRHHCVLRGARCSAASAGSRATPREQRLYARC